MRKLFFASIFILRLINDCQAQQQDSLAGMKLFVRVCNAYKQLPVQLELDIRHTANYVIDQTDTGHVQAKFCLRKDGSYISLGELEQVANDSLLLFVSNKLKRMIIYMHRQSLAEQLQTYLGWQQNDSSYLKMAGRYKIVLLPDGKDVAGGKDTAMLEVASRSKVPFCELPKESVRVCYNPLTFEPYEVRQLQRKLMPVSKADYDQQTARPETDLRSLVRRDTSYYVVRELLTTFRYDRITHQEGTLPVTIADRIAADLSGDYKPVKKYDGFSVTREF